MAVETIQMNCVIMRSGWESGRDGGRSKVGEWKGWREGVRWESGREGGRKVGEWKGWREE